MVWNRVSFSRELLECMNVVIVSIPNEYKEEREIRNGFEEFFCLPSHPSNDKVISAQRPGLKAGVENHIFWC